MNILKVISDVNFPAVFVAAFCAFVIGWIWYGPLYGKRWMELNGFSKEDLSKSKIPMPAIMGMNFGATLLAAFAIAMFVGDESNIWFGIFAGLMIAIFWIATNRLNDVLYEQKPIGLFWINVGYSAVTYTIMGAILGAWH